MIRTLLSAAVIALIAPVATAQVFVIGSGLAAECYEGANKGAARIYKKQFADAIAPLDRAISMETQDLYAAFYNRAIAKENTGDVPGAYYGFEKAVELNPEFETAKRQPSRFTVSQQ